MKFKVGDRVKFVKKTHSHSSNVKIGKIYTIDYVDEGTNIAYRVEEYQEWFKEEELELIPKQFTKNDLKDGDIVIYRNGDKRILINEGLLNEEGEICYYINEYTKDLKDKGENTIIDIVKVERPVKYKTVFERKEGILDESEKKYLSGVIGPWKDKVISITKSSNVSGEKECIVFNLKKEPAVALPYFKTGSQYKNMQVNREYTLEKLGL